MIKSKNILFSLIIIGVVSFINPDLHSPMVLPDFAFTVEVKDVHCTSDGELLFQVSNSDTSATITYTVFLKPELEKPYKVQNANTLRNLNAGEYRIVATQELDGLSSSQEVDVTINDLYEPLEFSVFVEDNCQGDDGKIMVEMNSGIASSYQIQGPVNRSPQTDNLFEDLPQGSYNVQVVNVCGERLSQTITLKSSNFTLDPERVDFVPLLESCGEISVGHYIASNGSVIEYPITLDFTVHLPGGGTEAVQSIVEKGKVYEGFVYGTIPFFNGTSYTYDVEITDACGNSVSSYDNPIEREFTISSDMRWGFGDCGKRMLAITPLNYTAPYTINFISYPDSFDPSISEEYPGPYYNETSLFGNPDNPIPDGSYYFEVVDACGNSTGELRMDQKTVTFSPSTALYHGCGPDVGSVLLSNNDYNMTLVEIINAPSTYPHDLPHRVTENVHKSNGQKFSMNNLPEGQYEFYVENDCGATHTVSVDVEGQNVHRDQVEVTKGCGAFNLLVQHESNQTAKQDVKFGLQKFDPETGTWGHPHSGEAYLDGTALHDKNSVLLFHNNINLNLPYSGNLRVVKASRYWKNGSETNSGESDYSICLDILDEFVIDYSLNLSGINFFGCTEDAFDVAIAATGLEPLNFSITSKDGAPFLLENGSDPFFQGLERGNYTFQIEDNCGNMVTRELMVQDENVPRIVPKNLCDGENGQLAVIGLDFLEFEWWKAGNPSEILGTGPSLSFAPYNSSTDTGLYQVRLTHSDPNSCLNEILEFEIPANDIGPQAGTGVFREFCEGETIDLFDLLEGPYDNFGVWEEVTESNALVGNLWLSKGLPEGTYEFTYTVEGLCKGEDKVNLTINLLPIPDAPFGNPLQGFCAFDQPTVANLEAEGENIAWYLQEKGGNALSNSHLLSDSTLYFAEQTVNGCPSGIRFETLVLIEKSIENNEIGPDQAIDRFSLPDLLVGSVPTGGIEPYQYQWQQSPDGQNWENIMGADNKDYQPELVIENVFFRRIVKSMCSETISNNIEIAVITVDMSITKTSFNKEIHDGEEFLYEIMVENNGLFDASQVTISDNLPSGVTYVSSEFHPSFQGMEVSSSNNENIISWDIADFPKGESIAIQLKVFPDKEGPILNKVEVFSEEEDVDLSNNVSQDQNTVLPLFIPNVIKPDSDGKNDYFVIRALGKFQTASIVIFNRWGDHVYESVSYENGWSAENLTAGTYYYVLKTVDNMGKENSYKGWVKVLK